MTNDELKTLRLYGKKFKKKYLKYQLKITEYKLKKLRKQIHEVLEQDMEVRDEELLRELLKARDWNEDVLKETEFLLSVYKK